MKHIVRIVMVLLLFTVTGCSNDEKVGNRVSNVSNVDKVIKEQIDSADTEIPSANIESETSSQQKNGSEKQEISSEKNEEDILDVDYDLTNMSSDMVYAIVYQMMIDPDTYIGKTFRMEGLYSAGYYEPTEQYYHYCLIQDALACCAQGLEFVWEDGNHIYPDEYPEEKVRIVVQGTFETYRENGDDYLYCRLKDANLEVKEP